MCLRDHTCCAARKRRDKRVGQRCCDAGVDPRSQAGAAATTCCCCISHTATALRTAHRRDNAARNDRGKRYTAEHRDAQLERDTRPCVAVPVPNERAGGDAARGQRADDERSQEEAQLLR